MSEAVLANASVARVAAALKDGGAQGQPIALAETARTAQEAADSIGCPLGAIVKSLVFKVGGRAVLALVAGDRQCDTGVLPEELGLDGKAKRADPDLVREATGFAIGGVAPVGHPGPLPTAIDASLGRFDVLYAAAGHPHAVFPTTLGELARLTGGRLTERLSR